MNTTCHIIRKDLRFNRWALLLWLTAVITHFALRCLQIKEPDWGGRALASSSRLDHIILFALPLMIIPFLMQADAFRRRYAFWQSLPISKTRLLLAKAITLLAVFILLPMAFEITYYYLAGLESVLWSSLKIWIYLHVPLVLIAYFLCFLTPGWKSYFCLMLPVAFVGMRIVVASIVTPPPSAFLPHPNAANIHKNIEAPAGTMFEVDEKSGNLHHSYTRLPMAKFPGKFTLESTITPTATFELADLPEDYVIMDMQGKVVTKIGNQQYEEGYTVRINKKNQHYNVEYSNEPTLSERSLEQSITGEKNAKNTFPLTLTKDKSILIEYENIPDEGVMLDGKISFRLAKRIVLKDLPFQEGVIWKEGLHSIKVKNIVRNNSLFGGVMNVTLDSITSDEKIHDPASLYPPNGKMILSLEHRRRPIRSTIDYFNRKDWYPYSEGVNDIARYRKTRSCDRQFGTLEYNQAPQGQLARLRFEEEENELEDWSLKLITYEPLGTVEYPFSLRIPKPANALKPEVALDEFANAMPPIGFQLKSIRYPSVVTDDSVFECFDQLKKALSQATESEIAKHEQEIYPILKSIYDSHPELLAKELHRQGEYLQASFQPTPHHYPAQLYVSQIHGIPPFWKRVTKVIETSATSQQKELLLGHIHPMISQRGLVERMGWEKETVQSLWSVAKDKRISDDWLDLILLNTGDLTNEFLLQQMRAGLLSLHSVARWLSNIQDEKTRQTIVAELWELTVRRPAGISSIHVPFLLALKHGIEVATRDFTRLVSNYNQVSVSEPDVDFLLLGLFQAMSQYSECPADVDKGAEWMMSHGKDLTWNATVKKFEIAASSRKQQPVVEDIWGKLYDPLGLMKIQSMGTGEMIQCRVLAHDMEFRSNLLERVTPRFVREVTGDFTMEITMAPQYSISPAWSKGRPSIFQGCGILVQAGVRHHFLVEHFLKEASQIQTMSEGITRRGRESYIFAENLKLDPRKPIVIKISRHGDELSSAFKQEGGEWVENPAHRVDHWPQTLKIGPYVDNRCIKPFFVFFSDYKITNQSQAPKRSFTPIMPEHPDSFKNGDNIPRWGQVVNPINGGSFHSNGNFLTVDTCPIHNDLNFQNTMVAPRTSNKVRGDFIQEVTIDPINAYGWSAAQLYLKSGNQALLRYGPVGIGRHTFIVHASTHEKESYVPPYQFTIDYQKPMRLRMRRTGNLCYVAVSQDDKEWQEMAPLYLKCDEEVEVGVTAMNTSKQSLKMSFRDYQLKPSAP